MRAVLDWLRVFSVREARAAWGRASVVVAVIAVSAALLVTVLGLIGSIDASIKRLADGIAGNAQLEISGFADGGFAESVLPVVQRVPGLSVAVPVVQAQVSSDKGPILLFGADASSIRLNGALRDAISDHLPALTSVPDGVLAGSGVGVKEGDRFKVGPGTVTIVGLLDGPEYSRINGGNYLLSPLRLAQKLSGRDKQLDEIFIIPKENADIETLRAALVTAIGGRALIAEPQARTAQDGMGVNLVRFVALSAGAFAFVISGFLIFTATGMSIAARRQHLSMMRAIGARRAPVVAGLIGEIALYGLVGGAIGSALGAVIGRGAIGSLPDAFMQTVTAKIHYELPVWAIPVGVAVSVIASATAAALAARQVYKVSPIEALAPVGVSVADVVPGWIRYAAVAVAAVTAALAYAISMLNLGLLSDAAISIMFGALLLVGFALGPVLVKTCAAVARLFGSAGAVAASSIVRSPQRVWVTMMTATVAVAATLAINGGGANAVYAARESFASMGRTDVWVSTRAAGLYPTGPVLPPAVANAVAAAPGVRTVQPALAGYTIVQDTKVMMIGLADGAPNPLWTGLTADARQQVLTGDGAVLSRDLANRLHLDVDDTLQLQTADGPKHVKVVAVVPFFSGLTGALGLRLDRIRTWFSRSGDTALQVEVLPGADRIRVAEAISRIVPSGVFVYTGDQAMTGIAQTLRQAFDLNNIVWIIVVVLSALALLNMLMLSILERRRELGVLRAIGSTRQFALRTILVEGLSVGVVGGALGILFGLIEQHVSDFASTQVWSVDVAFQVVPVAFTLSLGAIAVCVLGSVLPAIRAARTNIVEAVSND